MKGIKLLYKYLSFNLLRRIDEMGIHATLKML